jgi:5-enolpyruvylshikimate-3-phosphate synthase
LKPDVTFAAYAVAATSGSRSGRLMLKQFTQADIANSPISLLRRMGAALKPAQGEGWSGFAVRPAALKPRNISVGQLHAYPDAIGALALANAASDATSVIRSIPYSTDREGASRRYLCDVLKSLGARVAEISDGIVVEGRRSLAPSGVASGADAVAALTAVAAALGPVGTVEIDDVSAAARRWGRSFAALLELVR